MKSSHKPKRPEFKLSIEVIGEKPIGCHYNVPDPITYSSYTTEDHTNFLVKYINREIEALFGNRCKNKITIILERTKEDDPT